MKKQTIIIIILIIGIIGFILINLNTIDHLFNAEIKIKKIESEKVELKKKAEIEIKNLNKIIKTQRSIATSKDFEIVKRDKIIEDKDNLLKIKPKAKIRYKTKVIYKTSPVSDIWDFGEKVTFDFWKYVKESEKKDAVTKKIILDLKLINTKSEQQYKILKHISNSWSLNYGAFAGFGTGGFTAGVGLSYSKRVRKIK